MPTMAEILLDNTRNAMVKKEKKKKRYSPCSQEYYNLMRIDGNCTNDCNFKESQEVSLRKVHEKIWEDIKSYC